MLGVGATRVGGNIHRDGYRFYKVVRQEIIFNLFARNIGKHDAINLNAGRKRLTGLGDHLGVAVAIVDDVNVLKREAVLAQDGSNAV